MPEDVGGVTMECVKDKIANVFVQMFHF